MPEGHIVIHYLKNEPKIKKWYKMRIANKFEL